MKRAVIYARYSCDKQTEQSIEGQLHVCKDFASSNDYAIIGTYIDRAMSGTNDNRDEFQKMISDSNKGKFEYIIVYKLDRFARNRYDSVMNKSILKKNGVKLISATEPITDKPEGIILESLLEGMAEYYSAELSQKIKRGMKESRNKGLYTGGNKLYGYKIIDQHYVINDEEALLIKRIFREFNSGLKIKEITDKLNSEGITLVPNKKIKSNRISYILHNYKYTGRCEIAGVSYPNMIPAIIDEETFEYAKSILVKGKFKNARNRASSPFLLSGKVFCGHCNNQINGSSGTSKSKIVHYYYKCSNKTKNTNNCSCKTYRKDDFENFVLKCLLDKIMNPTVFNEIVNNTVELYNNEIKENLDLKILRNKLNDVDTKLNNYALAIGQGIFNSKTQEIMNSLIKDKENIETEIAIQESLQETPINYEIVANHLNKLFDYDSNDYACKKLIFDTFINKVIVYDDDNIVIVCNSLDKSLKRKNEHQLNMVFDYDFHGAACKNRTYT